MNTFFNPKSFAGILIFGFIVITGCNNRTDVLEDNFANPPHSSRPRTWMHAMSGNMSEAGLTKDLESIQEAGIGGVLLFNVSQGIPNGPVKYNSEQHHRLIQHAARECERLELSFGVHNCDGWSSSGGPWIEPEQSMKMVVWTETMVMGKEDLSVNLKQPTTREGYYRDVAVLAYPSLKSETADFENKPKITSSHRAFDLSVVADYRIDRESSIFKSTDEDPWIQYEYEHPHTIRSLHMVFNDRNGEAILQTSDDGKLFHTIKRDLYKVRTGKGEWDIADHFEPVTARFFRLQLNQEMTIKEARLMSTYSIQDFLSRSGLARTDDARMLPVGNPEESMAIPQESIIDLSDQMNEEGMLETNLPPGPWTILRFGYTSTGAFNHPASDEGRGLECDKFSREAFKIHYDAFVRRVIQDAKQDAPHAMQYIEIDSYEMGGQNWTEGFREIFSEKKGYDIHQFLPLFAGKFVENAEVSDAVLWDLREVYSHLMTENYFGYFSELCHRDGVQTYIEPYGNGPFNDLDAGGKADMVMGEFWMNRPITQVASAVSAGHTYGKEVISAESFTSTPEINWMGHPGMAKLSGDRAWATGINEFMFHRFVHQANTNVKPGLTMNRWGFHFDRTQTWWENAGPSWFMYIARGSYLLRQGVPVSDLLVFVGDGSPNSTFSRNDFNPGIPVGTNFDCVNRDVLINRIRIEHQHLVLPEGTHYKALVLKNCDKLSHETLKRIHQIAMAGVPVQGLADIEPSGFLVSEELRADFENMVDEMHNQPNCYSGFNWTRLFSDMQLKQDMTIKGSEDIDFIHRRIGSDDFYFLYNPDSVHRVFECTFRVGEKIPELWNPMDGKITKAGRYTHKDDQCIAWIHLDANESTFVGFRKFSKRVPSVSELAENSLEGRYELNDKNRLVLKATQNGSYGALLRSGEHVNFMVNNLPEPILLSGPWEVEFLEKHGYAKTHNFNELTDWRDHTEEGVNYYAGTAIYRKSFDLPDSQINDEIEYFLDLGGVHIVAEVKLNGVALGVEWIEPYRLSITEALKAGENHLEVVLTNQWSNRLIGDERFPDQGRKIQLEGNYPKGKMPDWYVNNEALPEGPRSSFCSGNFYTSGDELMPSGLVGPVFITAEKSIIIK